MGRVGGWAHPPVTLRNPEKPHLLLGGSFDPVHIGHVRLAIECVEQTGGYLDFVPCAVQPHTLANTHPNLAKAPLTMNSALRVACLRAVLGELNAGLAEPHFGLELCEMEREGPSYTVDTLAALRTAWPQARLAWVMGMDCFARLHTWHRWQMLFELANVLVVPRWSETGTDTLVPSDLLAFAEQRRCDPQNFPIAGAIAFADTPVLTVSSRDIRRRLAAGLSVRYLLPDLVHSLVVDATTSISS